MTPSLNNSLGLPAMNKRHRSLRLFDPDKKHIHFNAQVIAKIQEWNTFKSEREETTSPMRTFHGGTARKSVPSTLCERLYRAKRAPLIRGGSAGQFSLPSGVKRLKDRAYRDSKRRGHRGARHTRPSANAIRSIPISLEGGENNPPKRENLPWTRKERRPPFGEFDN